MRGRIPAEHIAPLQAKTTEIERRQFANALRDDETKGSPFRRSRLTQRRGGPLDSEWRRAPRRGPQPLPVGVGGGENAVREHNWPSGGPRPRF
jgi:hypothetical protein